MPKRTVYNLEELPAFAAWLAKAMERRGITLKKVSVDTEIDYTQLFKTMHSDRPQYAQNYRLGYDNTVKVGELFGDVAGALKSADYSEPGGTVPSTLTADQRAMLDLMERDPIAAARLLLDRATSQQRPAPAASEFDVAPDPSIRPNLKPSGYAPSPADEAALKARMAEEFKEKQQR